MTKLTVHEKNSMKVTNFVVSNVIALAAYYFMKKAGKTWKQRLPYAVALGAVSTAVDVAIGKL